MLILIFPVLLLLGTVRMNCHNCGEEFADDDQLFFYVKGQKEVYLAIKPELKAFFEEKKQPLDPVRQRKILVSSVVSATLLLEEFCHLAQETGN